MDGVCLETQISEDGGQTFRHTELSPMDFRKIAPIKFDDDDNDGEVPEVPINHVYQEGRTEGPLVYTQRSKSIYLIFSVWSKTTLITGAVGHSPIIQV